MFDITDFEVTEDADNDEEFYDEDSEEMCDSIDNKQRGDEEEES